MRDSDGACISMNLPKSFLLWFQGFRWQDFALTCHAMPSATLQSRPTCTVVSPFGSAGTGTGPPNSAATRRQSATSGSTACAGEMGEERQHLHTACALSTPPKADKLHRRPRPPINYCLVAWYLRCQTWLLLSAVGGCAEYPRTQSMTGQRPKGKLTQSRLDDGGAPLWQRRNGVVCAQR